MKCEKCGYESKTNRKKGDHFFCDICYLFSPEEENLLKEYSSERIDPRSLESFRKYFKPGERQKKSMIKKAAVGNLMSRVAFGYKLENKKLVPAENYKEIEEIFEEFLTGDYSLRQLAEKHKLSVNGLKKILKNFTYIGKIKFNNQIYEGNHTPLVSTTLFNHVQNKLEKI
jgi:hypothetical protein